VTLIDTRLMKTCTICGQIKPLRDFHARSDSTDGRRADCHVCCAARNTARYAANAEHIKAAARARHWANRDQVLATNRRYRAANAPLIAAKTKAWRDNNPDRARRSKRASRERHWAAYQTLRQRAKAAYRARLAGARVERVNFQTVWERDGGLCGLCGLSVDPNDRHFDHIVPLKAGGVHATWNLQVAHPMCNRRKGARLA
jgi:5-methylcytosine-specific restriction endonuclease McrA